MREGDDTLVDQVIEEQAVAAREQIAGLQGQQPRVAGTGANQVHVTGFGPKERDRHALGVCKPRASESGRESASWRLAAGASGRTSHLEHDTNVWTGRRSDRMGR